MARIGAINGVSRRDGHGDDACRIDPADMVTAPDRLLDPDTLTAPITSSATTGAAVPTPTRCHKGSTTSVVVNGRTYGSIDELPAAVRAQVEATLRAAGLRR